ncbi:MAG: flagellar biosynthetic protein FliQ [Oscillospiraceae bacterium]|jgi:flagellar biosynthetic protein FliQ|nr:flagellar biosynthetic protein FliQ [Oscillospiraceae bacterium]
MEGRVLALFNEAILVAFKLSLPILLSSMVLGLVISMLQAATQIQEQTLTFIPKVILLGVMLIVLGPWMTRLSTEFIAEVFRFMADIIK